MMGEEERALRAKNETPWQKPGSRIDEVELEHGGQRSGRSWLSFDPDIPEKNHSVV
jgi:hypothetical protein